jgi:hypothetical protein
MKLDSDEAAVHARIVGWASGDERMRAALLRVRDVDAMFGLEKPDVMLLFADGVKVDVSLWPPGRNDHPVSAPDRGAGYTIRRDVTERIRLRQRDRGAG